jgi:hypothetical protein
MAFSFFDYFKRSQKSASLAKDRLSIIVARERATTRGASDYLPQLQQELLNIVMPEEAAPAKGLGGGAGSRPGAAVSSHV